MEVQRSMSGSEDDRERVVGAMIRRAIAEVQGLNWSNDYDLIEVLMTTLYDNGFTFDRLEVFASDGGARALGVLRGRHHYAGVGRVRQGFGRHYSCIVVETTGVYAGLWYFVIDTDHTILTSRNGEGVEDFCGKEGVDLIRAVIVSALTEEIPPSAPKRSWWPF